jgi:acyl-coenzyme A thioesterase PaaI-like protein
MSPSLVPDVESAAVSPRKASPPTPKLLNPRCIGCGPLHPHGLHLHFTAEANTMKARWIPDGDWESFPGIIHGGIISTALDEAMSKAILATGVQAFTVDLRLRYRHKLSTGQPVEIHGWMVQKEKRRITAEAAVCSLSGEEYAHAWGIFLLAPRSATPSATPVGTKP